MSLDKKGRVLLAISGLDTTEWRNGIARRRAVVLPDEAAGDASIHYAVVWKQPSGLLASLPGLKAIFSMGAGVDHLVGDVTLPDVPIVRVVAENLTRHMTEYVVWRVMDHHRQGRLYRERQGGRVWEESSQPVASDVAVGIMGIGELGQAAARRLDALGFDVAGWRRSGGAVDGIRTFTGSGELDAFLGRTDILVVLLPLTPDTRGIVDHSLLSRLRRGGPLGGPVLINAGRGGLQREADILRALEDGTLQEASLDVFETEPLPAQSPLWTHPRVFVTPHAAATSDPAELVPAMLDQMDAHDRGEPLRNLVDRSAGY